MKYLFPLLLLLVALGCRTSDPSLALVYKYSPPVVEGKPLSIEHFVVNVKGPEVIICNLGECIDYSWQFSPLPDEEDADLLLEGSGIIMCGMYGMHESPRNFIVLNVSTTNSLYGGTHTLDVPLGATQLLYRATFGPCRDGKEFSIQAWTGKIPGDEIRIPITKPNKILEGTGSNAPDPQN